ncbi:hypothetical protein CLU79DRAFT_721260 [Phycomyces nitens]|nr:hypothetical protein CLU79DRAFT_721260 [Phycomyces nitens]
MTLITCHYQPPSSIVQIHSPDIDERWDICLDSQKHPECLYMHPINILPASPRQYTTLGRLDSQASSAHKTVDYFGYPDSSLDSQETTPDSQEPPLDDDQANLTAEDGFDLEAIRSKKISMDLYHRLMAQRYTARLLKISVCQTSLPPAYQKYLDSLQVLPL